MKLLAFTDLHSSMGSLKKVRAKIKKHKPDYVLCLGDSTYFGDLPEVFEEINKLKAPVLMLPGNEPHESIKEVRKLCKKYDNITFVHKKVVELQGYTLVAHGGGGFYGHGEDARDEDFEKFIKRKAKKIKRPVLLITHAPPHGTKLDYLDWLEEHVGCISYRDFIEEIEPLFALSGHIHESFNKKQKIGKTLVCNPSPQGKVFKITKNKVSIMR